MHRANVKTMAAQILGQHRAEFHVVVDQKNGVHARALSVLSETTPIGKQGNAENVTNCHKEATVRYPELPIVTAVRAVSVSSEDGDRLAWTRTNANFRYNPESGHNATLPGPRFHPESLRISGRRIVHGVATDPSGARVVKATVIAQAADGTTSTVQTSADGAYVFPQLAPGIYTINVTAQGLSLAQPQVVTVSAGHATVQNLALSIEVEKQQVTVSEQGAGLDTSPDNNANAIVIKGKDLDALSDDPDELQNELNALAGPAAGPNGGEIYIDGFSGGQLPPKSSIREIRINQNPFSAQYDKLGYGRIEILTKPGTDKLHGIGDGQRQRFLLQLAQHVRHQRAVLLLHVYAGQRQRLSQQPVLLVRSVFRRDNRCQFHHQC